MTSRRGRCLCEAVRFSVDVPRLEIDACHCHMCRRWAGGPLLVVTADGPPRFDDEAALGVYRSSAWGERLFCTTCGSSILWRSVDGTFHHVPAALIDDLDGVAFTTEIFVDQKPAYYDFAGERRRMTGAEASAALAGDDDG